LLPAAAAAAAAPSTVEPSAFQAPCGASSLAHSPDQARRRETHTEKRARREPGPCGFLNDAAARQLLTAIFCTPKIGKTQAVAGIVLMCTAKLVALDQE
jgi:hypothetical protein